MLYNDNLLKIWQIQCINCFMITLFMITDFVCFYLEVCIFIYLQSTNLKSSIKYKYYWFIIIYLRKDATDTHE